MLRLATGAVRGKDAVAAAADGGTPVRLRWAAAAAVVSLPHLSSRPSAPTTQTGTDYGPFLANEPSPMHTTSLVDACTRKLVADWRYLRENVSGGHWCWRWGQCDGRSCRVVLALAWAGWKLQGLQSGAAACRAAGACYKAGSTPANALNAPPALPVCRQGSL